MIIVLTTESLIRIALLLHAPPLRLAYHRLIPRQIITHHAGSALLVGTLLALLRAIFQHVIPRAAAPQVSRVDRILHAHSRGITHHVLVAHIEADHIVAALVIASGGAGLGTFLD